MIASRPLQLCTAPLPPLIHSLSLSLSPARMAMIFETAYTFYALLSEMAVIRARPQSVASRRPRILSAVYVNVHAFANVCVPGALVPVRTPSYNGMGCSL